jgi:hypothetical protein
MKMVERKLCTLLAVIKAKGGYFEGYKIYFDLTHFWLIHYSNAWCGNCTARIRKALQRAVHHQGQTTCPPGHLQHLMSQEGQKDYQGQRFGHLLISGFSLLF